MSLSSRSLSLLCSSLLGGAALAPRPASACSPDPCIDSARFVQFEPMGGSMAADGVLAFRMLRYGGLIDDATALGFVQVDAVDEQGMPIAGALEIAEPWGLALWRPATALAPGQTVQLSVLVDNDALGLAHDEDWLGPECGANIELDLPLAVGEALPVFGGVEATPTSTHAIAELLALDSLICCDGALPRSEDFCGSSDVYWIDGSCASTRGLGSIDAGFLLDVEALAPEVAADLAFELVSDGWITTAAPGALQITTRANEPFCAHVEVSSLATGESLASRQVCFGDDVADELGEIAIDPLPGLQECSGEPYTCAIDGDGWSEWWDPNACAPWGGSGSSGDSAGSSEGGWHTSVEDGGSYEGGSAEGSSGWNESSGEGGGADGGAVTDRGCACSSQPHRPVGFLAIVLAAAIRRRRR